MPHRTTRAAVAAWTLLSCLLSLALACGDATAPASSPPAPDARMGLDPQGGASAEAGTVAIAPPPGDAAVAPACACPAPTPCPAPVDAGAPEEAAVATPAPLPPWFIGDAGRALTWIAHGDSMTHPNYLDASDTVYMYPTLAGFLLGPAVHIVNQGMSGDTLSDQLARMGYADGVYLPDGGACVISVLAGTNDLRSYDASVTDVCGWYEAFGEEVHSKYGCAFVALTLPPPDDFVDAAARDQVDDCVRHLASADLVVDLAAHPELAAMTIGDGTHPGFAGHERIAQVVAPAIRDVLLDAGARMP